MKLEEPQEPLVRSIQLAEAFLESLESLATPVAYGQFRELASRFYQSHRRQIRNEAKEQAGAQAEQQLDQLLKAMGWSHPVQVLERPRADLAVLLKAGRLRLPTVQGVERQHLQEALAKLERALRIENSARRRRQEARRRALKRKIRKAAMRPAMRR